MTSWNHELRTECPKAMYVNKRSVLGMNRHKLVCSSYNEKRKQQARNLPSQDKPSKLLLIYPHTRVVETLLIRTKENRREKCSGKKTRKLALNLIKHELSTRLWFKVSFWDPFLTPERRECTRPITTRPSPRTGAGLAHFDAV